MKYIKIIVDRDSVCMADDVFSHSKSFEFSDEISMADLIDRIEKINEFKSYGGGIWAGKYDNYKCIRSNQKEWRIDKLSKAKVFFYDIENHLQFERNSKKCE